MLKTKRKIIEREIDGVEEKVHLRPALYGQVRAWMKSKTGDRDSLKECVVDSGGKPILTDQDIDNLPTDVFLALVDSVLQINGLGKTKNG